MGLTDMKYKIGCYIRRICWVGMLLVTGISCQDGRDITDGLIVEGVELTLLANSGLRTRTTLPIYEGTADGEGISGVQHVTDVFLYVFEQDADKQDFTCRAMQDVRWAEYQKQAEGGILPTHTSSMPYTVNYAFQAGKTYRLVAVGLDCGEKGEMPDWDGRNSAYTYGLPDAIGTGTKLSQAIRMLDGRDTDDLMHSELFAGSLDFTPSDSKKVHLGTLTLFRRVAGLQVCLEKIPEDVERVRVLLYNSQNTAVPVIPADPDFVTSPFGGDAHHETGRVLMDIGKDSFLKEEIWEGTGVASKIVYSCQETVFLLPVNVPDKEMYDYTLMVEFISTGITGIVGESTKIRLVKPWKEEDNLELGSQYDIGTGIIDDLNKYLFPIVANHFYCLGTPKRPIDCSGALQKD